MNKVSLAYGTRSSVCNWNLKKQWERNCDKKFFKETMANFFQIPNAQNKTRFNETQDYTHKNCTHIGILYTNC